MRDCVCLVGLWFCTNTLTSSLSKNHFFSDTEMWPKGCKMFMFISLFVALRRIRNQQTECHSVFFLSRLGFLLFLRRSICELNSLCKDCHCDVLAARDEIAAGDVSESEDESYVQPSTSSGSNTD